jgi:hypothetical protein
LCASVASSSAALARSPCANSAKPCGFVDVLDDLIARLRGELFQLMDRPVGLFRLPGRSIHTRPLAPDQAEQSVAFSFRDSFECAGVLQGGLKGIELNELNIWIRSKQGLPA